MDLYMGEYYTTCQQERTVSLIPSCVGVNSSNILLKQSSSLIKTRLSTHPNLVGSDDVSSSGLHWCYFITTRPTFAKQRRLIV